MDTVEGAREDSACLPTLLHRPSRLQLALPLEEKTAGCVADALGGVIPSTYFSPSAQTNRRRSR